MKHSDVDKIHEAGLISAEQRQTIIEHFHLKPEDGGSKLLAIISSIGAVMVIAGIVLLISSNWNNIPRGVKLSTGLLLLIGFYAGGYYLRDFQSGYAKTGEALYQAGALMFLANIALIGQVYHLSSRPANAILLWWVGIAALPWLLRSKPLHALGLLVFSGWFIWESNLPDSLIYVGDCHQFETCVFAVLGLAILGGGYCLRHTSFSSFAPLTEYFGLLGFCGFSYPLVWKYFYDPYGRYDTLTRLPVISMVLATLALALILVGLGKEKRLTRQWRWTWGTALTVTTISLTFLPLLREMFFCSIFAAILLFVLSLLHIQVGLRLQSPPMVNLSIAFIALILVALYVSLVDTMERTGWLFLISGVFLVGFGLYLEKKRRHLLQRMHETRNSSAPPSAC
jgi:uncharacterized membrane protein